MRDDFASRLQSGSTGFVAAISPPPPDAIRARGDKRRRRKAITSAVLALALAAGGSGVAYTSFDRPGETGLPGTYSSPASSSQPGSRPGIVAVTTRGALVVLSPVTGEATRILVGSGVAADAISVSPGGSAVYFAVREGCRDEIESVPLTGGRPTAITSGVLPAVSPDGTKLAFAREPFSGGPSDVVYLPGCLRSSTGSQSSVVVRDLATGHETAYPAPPGTASVLPVPVAHLSWAPDGGQLLVSVGPSQDNEGWDLVVMDPATSRYYLPSGNTALSGSGVPVTGGADAAGSYYREGVFLPDGAMFVNRICCAGWPVRETSSLLWEIGSAGQLIRQVAIGFSNRDHSSLAVDPSGHWLLYLSGQDLFLSRDGAAPFMLTSGLIAAAWLS
jgi:hypothetical protein